jgi:transcription antitermination protein NusB
MGIRRQARECALQMLYQLDLSGLVVREVLKRFWEVSEAPPEVRRFANSVVEGVASQLTAIDERISAHSTNWKLSRMAAVDKNILRMAVFELVDCPDIPVKVTINEAVEIAKRFGSAESGAFVNGILDNIARDIVKAAAEETEPDA